MATRVAARFASRRLFSSGSGKVLGEEEKAVENAYFKKAEQEKLEKLARKGPQPEAKPAAGSEANPAAGSGGSVTDAKPSGSGHSDTSGPKVSSDKYRNYGVVAGTITIFAALGWYLKGTAKKPEVHED